MDLLKFTPAGEPVSVPTTRPLGGESVVKSMTLLEFEKFNIVEATGCAVADVVADLLRALYISAVGSMLDLCRLL